jgi:hypothetical protein
LAPTGTSGGAGGAPSTSNTSSGEVGGGFSVSASSSGGAGGAGDPCASQSCAPDQHCEAMGNTPSCVPNNCNDLQCAPTEECQTTPNGALCVDISCTEDVECAASEYCDGTVCVPDVCVPGAANCQGADLYECASNGSGTALKYTCGGAAYFASACIDNGMGDAYCSCEDDWDCPAHTACEARRCEGSGQPPTCFLPPEPIANALPVPEITWGGAGIGNANAIGSPFEPSAQVVMTPLVANLDDDNGDGLIDERDFPEIIFTTFCGSDYQSNGVLRAIHGGGPNKGGDFSATCGNVVWNEGEALPVSCTCSTADIDSTAVLAVGDLDYDGVPEIVAITENDLPRIYSNTGELLATGPSTGSLGGANPAPAIANLDNQGPAEIVIGRNVFSVAKTGTAWQFVDHWEGTLQNGSNGQGPSSCVANVTGDSRLEIAAVTTLYRFPVGPLGALSQADCTGMESGDEAAWCNGSLPAVWDATAVGPGVSANGFCAIADVWGADPASAPGPNNPLDGMPEVVTITSGFVQVFDGQTGALMLKQSIAGTSLGGPPNVDDFDGDGYPEIGTAGSTGYVVIDLQATATECPAWPTAPANDTLSCSSANPARTPPMVGCMQDIDCGDVSKFACNEATQSCICLHNGWRRATEDDSSQVTGSSVFDFNGDGAAEVIYNDECRFRLYDGLNGDVHMSEPSESRTRIEYPVVADVDNDGNAEIVFATTNESGFCSQNLDSFYNNGIEVWGDQNDYWVSARRIWSQHGYHVTNITEDGMPPLFEPESWGDYNGRSYNVYRSNPRTQGIAPDLSVMAVQIASPNATCGQLSDEIEISVQIQNLGDLRVGPGVVVGFHGHWMSQALDEPLYADPAMTPLELVLQTSIEPGASIYVTVPYDAANNAPMVLPDSVTVSVDQGLQERECNETNNELTTPVVAGQPEADLRVELALPSAMPSCPTVPTVVYNDGSAPASGVVVRYYAGDPSQGGNPLHEVVVPGTIPAGGNVSFDTAIPNFPDSLSIQIWGVVDPDNVISECNDGNNNDAANAKIECGSVN